MEVRAILLSCVFFITAFQSLWAGDLVIMHTNDTHGNMVPERKKDFGGVERRKVLIDSIRGAERNILLVDAGDDVQGFLYFTLYKGEVEYEAMNRMGYDFTVPGNHEFDNGMQALADNYSRLNAVKLCANYDFSGTPVEGLTQEYAIKEYEGRRIALIGVGCQPKGMIAPECCEGMVYSDAVSVADSVAGMLKSQGSADYVIVVSHLGYEVDRPELPSDSILAVTSRNIDLIIGGHTHTVIDPSATDCPRYVFKNRDGKDVMIAQTGKWGEYLGKITIDLDNLNDLPQYELFPVDSRYDGRYDADFSAWLQEYTDGVEELKHEVIGRSAAAYDAGEMNPLSNWVADAVYDIAAKLTGKKIDLAIINKGGIRQPLPEGDVSLGLVLTMLPFTNSVVVMEIDGKSLQEGLDVMAGRGGDAVSRQVCAGMKGGKAVDVMIDGKPLEPDKTYTVATIDYLANGGDNMASFAEKGKVVARSEEQLKNDIINHIKQLTIAGEAIMPDTAVRMKKIN